MTEQWITVERAMKMVKRSRDWVMLIGAKGNIRRKEIDDVYYFHKGDLKAYYKDVKKGVSERCVDPKRRAIRPKEAQPDVSDDIDKLVNGWCGSANQRRFAKRFSRR